MARASSLARRTCEVRSLVEEGTSGLGFSCLGGRCMRDVFLSASVPGPNDEPYCKSANPLLIHSAIRSLCTFAFGRKRIVWGGHPAITPMMWAACENLGVDYAKTVHLYQSRFFPVEMYPEENSFFRNVTYIKAEGDLKASLAKMREAMIASHDFEAGVFVGGKDGVEVEFEIFRDTHPDANVIILPSTGGAAKLLGERYPQLSGPAGDFVDFISYMAKFIAVEGPNTKPVARNKEGPK